MSNEFGRRAGLPAYIDLDVMAMLRQRYLAKAIQKNLAVGGDFTNQTFQASDHRKSYVRKLATVFAGLEAAPTAQHHVERGAHLAHFIVERLIDKPLRVVSDIPAAKPGEIDIARQQAISLADSFLAKRLYLSQHVDAALGGIYPDRSNPSYGLARHTTGYTLCSLQTALEKDASIEREVKVFRLEIDTWESGDN